MGQGYRYLFLTGWKIFSLFFQFPIVYIPPTPTKNNDRSVGMVLRMPEVQPGMTPLARLVLCMICLSVAGSFAAGIHWYAVDLPSQPEVQVPENNEVDNFIACKKECDRIEYVCHINCERDNSCHRCESDNDKCMNKCVDDV